MFCTPFDGFRGALWRMHAFCCCLGQAIQAHVGQLMDAVLSPKPDEENAQAIARILDRCEEQHKGAGATLALGYLDTVWWLPAPIRPEIGALAILAVYEALRRFGVFTRCDWQGLEMAHPTRKSGLGVYGSILIGGGGMKPTAGRLAGQY